jgi:hypothetical protein
MLPTPCWARFKRSGDRWFTFDGRDATDTVDALQLVIDAPEFLGQSSTQTLPRAAMAPPQSHSNRVLVVVDEAGGVQLAVCPEPGGDAATVVGDVVATGHRFWRKKYNAMAEPFQEFLGTSLTDWVAGRVGDSWSAEEFRAGLERSMSEGKFPITIVVNELDPAVKETLDYLREVNQQVRVLGYTCMTSGGDELIWPRELSEERVASRSKPAQPQTRPSGPHSSPKPPSRPHPVPVQQSAPPDDSAPTAAFQAQPEEPTGFGPLPAYDVTPEQEEILTRLIQLDDLGLVRKGLEYYLAGDDSEATATLVLAIEPDHWPFPKPDEVIVVVNTGSAHMAGFLGIASREIEEFLSALPRVEQKEHKGSILLRAASIDEAAKVVNDLRELKEATAGSID